MRVVYVDTLFLLNLLVDYFLLRLTASVGGVYPKFSRMFLGAMVGAILADKFHLCISLNDSLYGQQNLSVIMLHHDETAQLTGS